MPRLRGTKTMTRGHTDDQDQSSRPPPRPPRSVPTRRRYAPATPSTCPARSVSIPRRAICAKASQAQARQVVANLRRSPRPRAVRSTTSSSITLLLADMADFAHGQRDHGASSFAAPYPARATYQVAALPKGARVEIEGVLIVQHAAIRGRTSDVRRQQGAVAPRWPRKSRRARQPRPATRLEDKLARIGIAREQDLVLHLPLRYEDHTHSVPAARAASPGRAWQVEGAVVKTEIQYRGRRQLVCLLEDEATAQLVLRFFHFYPNQQKALAEGKRVRAFGEVREGHFGSGDGASCISRHRARDAAARRA